MTTRTAIDIVAELQRLARLWLLEKDGDKWAEIYDALRLLAEAADISGQPVTGNSSTVAAKDKPQ